MFEYSKYEVWAHGALGGVLHESSVAQPRSVQPSLQWFRARIV